MLDTYVLGLLIAVLGLLIWGYEPNWTTPLLVTLLVCGGVSLLPSPVRRRLIGVIGLLGKGAIRLLANAFLGIYRLIWHIFVKIYHALVHHMWPSRRVDRQREHVDQRELVSHGYHQQNLQQRQRCVNDEWSLIQQGPHHHRQQLQLQLQQLQQQQLQLQQLQLQQLQLQQQQQRGESIVDRWGYPRNSTFMDEEVKTKTQIRVPTSGDRYTTITQEQTKRRRVLM